MERRFGEAIPSRPIADDVSGKGEESGNGEAPPTQLIDWVREKEIGGAEIIETPFGRRKMLYCDYAASARAIGPIEEYIQNEVLPLYGNTHSSVTVSSEQTTLFVHEARQEVRAMVGAGDGDVVIYTGNGTTAAVELLVHLLGDNLKDSIVLHSDREHHSNLLPWRQRAKQCWEVEEDANGRICINSLCSLLEKIRVDNPQTTIIGTFSAASNVCGVVNNINEVVECLKRYGALSFWDYATAAPYVDINVNGQYPLDAAFFSGHKFVGGTATPGVLVVKRKIIQATTPKRIGGGTVFFVSRENEWYLKEPEYREEGGTQDAIGAVRLALAIKLKRSIGEAEIERREEHIGSIFLRKLLEIPNIILLGPTTVKNRLPIFAFLIRDAASGLYLHHNLVSALLNDLFGIQTRPGCVCAGPYAQKILGIDTELSHQYLSILRERDGLDRVHLRRIGEYSHLEMLRPGFTRVSLPFFITDKQIHFITESIKFVAKHATDFMHLYVLNGESAEWHHHKQRTFHARKWIGHVEFGGKEGMRVQRRKELDQPVFEYKDCLEEAEKLREAAKESAQRTLVPDGRLALDTVSSPLRWFLFPIEVQERSQGKKVEYPQCPFQPRKYDCDSVEQSNSQLANIVLSKEDSKEDQEEFIEEDYEKDHIQSTPPNSNGIVNGVLVDKEEEDVSCPLDPSDTGKGRMGDMGTDENPEEIKESEDWNRRTVVHSISLSPREKSALPWVRPPLELYKRVTEAIHGMNMIQNGDRILVCLSGGKDSLAMLHILHFYRERCIKNRSTQFDLGAITVDPGSSAYNPRPLIEYCRKLNIDYFYEEQDIIGQARRMGNIRSICAFCSRLKRGRLAAAAQLHGYNVLAMGQHLDDLAESFFIAAFQNGNLSTMKAQYNTRDGALRVIRPMVFVREKQLRDFAEGNQLPVIAENCPACFSQATERHRIKQMLASQELVFPDLFHSLRSALRPLLLVDSACTDEMRARAIANIVESNKGKIKSERNNEGNALE